MSKHPRTRGSGPKGRLSVGGLMAAVWQWYVQAMHDRARRHIPAHWGAAARNVEPRAGGDTPKATPAAAADRTPTSGGLPLRRGRGAEARLAKDEAPSLEE